MTTTTIATILIAFTLAIVTNNMDPATPRAQVVRVMVARDDRLAKAEARKRARLEYKEAKDKLASIRKAIARTKGEGLAVLQVNADRMEARVADLRARWKELVARDTASRVSRKDRKRGPRAGAVPTPEGFEFVLRPRDFYHQAIDPSWTPPPSQRTALGKYVFHTFHEESGVPVEAFIRIRVPGSGVTDQELARLVSDYFDGEDARVYWGRVRVLMIDRDTRPYKRDQATVKISTDHRRIRGIIHPSDQVYRGPYRVENSGGGAPAANQGSRTTARATTDHVVSQDADTVNGGE